MKQTERLLQLVNLLRNRRTVLTAQQLADEFGVSLRTIYRDIQKLESSGIPIEGEAGVGYRIHRSVNLPPLMFDADEVEALMLGVKMVKAWSDSQLSLAAQSALHKIVGALPGELKHIGDTLPFKVPVFPDFIDDKNPSALLREAIKKKITTDIKYTDAKGAFSQRLVYPLGLLFWGNVWTLAAWCCLRQDYRAFRLDRIVTASLQDQYFEHSKECSLEHYMESCKHS